MAVSGSRAREGSRERLYLLIFSSPSTTILSADVGAKVGWFRSLMLKIPVIDTGAPRAWDTAVERESVLMLAWKRCIVLLASALGTVTVYCRSLNVPERLTFLTSITISLVLAIEVMALLRASTKSSVSSADTPSYLWK